MSVPIAPDGSTLSVLISTAAWALTAAFAAVVLFWVVEVAAFGTRRKSRPVEHGYEEIQVRILTIDAEAVVQETVNSLPPGLSDSHVIAEEPIDVEGATVHVVPDDFECAAVRKGRAMEWARRTLPCEAEYVLYLDEDSLVTDFGGLPDADVVQIQERPRRTDSFLTFFADIYRVGLRFEQRAFERLSIPLYAWGGGLAVRKSVEEEVTWNRASLVEDTAFVWRASLWADADYALADAAFMNQAPPSFSEILQQRRRWIAGNHREASVLPRNYRWVSRIRNAVGGVSPFAPLVFLPAAFSGIHLLGVDALTSIALVPGAFVFVWFFVGLYFYDIPVSEALAGVALAPAASILHSLGVFFGLVAPPEEFRVTRKVPPEEWLD